MSRTFGPESPGRRMTTTGCGRGSLGFAVLVGLAVCVLGFFVGAGLAVGVVLVGDVVVGDVVVGDVEAEVVALPVPGSAGVVGPHAAVLRASAPRAMTVKACRAVPRGRAYRMVSPIPCNEMSHSLTR
ncbi:MAG TPA: hypothetical protein VFY98_01280 [Intrasporangium sp.]|nr:hypothetical protein [Intrasporangium sp.]